jgi:oligoendopeptidase F
LRARVTGAMQPSYPDLFAPLSEERRFSLTEAREMAIAASEPVGKTYVAKLRERIHQPWMHLISSPQKRNTYAIWPPVGGTPPFVIMTYQDTYDSARRLTGALTLMMSFEEWRQANAPETRDDPGIYSNGVIYAGDMLFDDYAESHSQNSGDQIASLIYALDLFRHHYFHWAMNSEFDARVQERIKKGDIPTGKTLSALYLQILREYYGPALSVDESFGKEWMINSVPFSSYEHQFWPAAMAAGCNMIEGLRRQDANAQEAIYQVLGRSNSDRTYNLLLQAGIDLSQPDAYEPVFARMTRLLDKLEKLL